MSLDNKLKEIVSDTPHPDVAVETIKQAFINEGWHNTVLVPQGDNLFVERSCMPKQEFYDRFIQALDDEFHQFSKPTFIEGVHYDAVNVHKAARKAAGL